MRQRVEIKYTRGGRNNPNAHVYKIRQEIQGDCKN